MTCIVGLVHDGKIYMGGDGQYLAGWRKIRSSNPKIFRLGDMLIGTERSQRVSDIVQYALDLDDDLWDDPTIYLLVEFIPKLQECLKAHGSMLSKEGIDEMDATIMIGYKGHLFIIAEDFSLSQIGSAYEAIGGGAKYAVGYLYATDDIVSIGPEQAIENAISCASHFSASCGGPITILDIEA